MDIGDIGSSLVLVLQPFQSLVRSIWSDGQAFLSILHGCGQVNCGNPPLLLPKQPSMQSKLGTLDQRGKS